jgi:hypothetical protein
MRHILCTIVSGHFDAFLYRTEFPSLILLLFPPKYFLYHSSDGFFVDVRFKAGYNLTPYSLVNYCDPRNLYGAVLGISLDFVSDEGSLIDQPQRDVERVPDNAGGFAIS